MSADDHLYAPVNTPAPAANTLSGNIAVDLKLPPSWLTVMNTLRSWRPDWNETALAGGALRDLDLGRPVKDVDIFMPATVDRRELEQALQPCSYEKLFVDEVTHDPNSNSALSNGVKAPSHFTFGIDGWRFEVTQKFEPFTQRSIIDSFDLGICMICLLGNAVYRAPEYRRDVNNKHITIVQSTGGREMNHAGRLQKKYQGWTVVQ